MARLASVVVPGVPHHVTQRGNQRLATFFNEADYAAYLALMVEGLGPEQAALLRRDARTGQALGSAAFVQRLEALEVFFRAESSDADPKDALRIGPNRRVPAGRLQGDKRHPSR